MPLVTIENVSKRFRKGELWITPLEEASLAIDSGELIALTGSSGTGKSTLLNLVAGIDRVDAGRIVVGETEITSLSRSRLADWRAAHLGYIFQTHNLFDSITAYQNVLLATELRPYSRGEADRRSNEILARVELSDYQHKKPPLLSEGQRQRVAICRALVNTPKLVLADEPTAALDPERGRMVFELFREVARDLGTTVLIVTHDSRILDLADRVIRMVNGKVVSDIHPEAPRDVKDPGKRWYDGESQQE